MLSKLWELIFRRWLRSVDGNKTNFGAVLLVISIVLTGVSWVSMQLLGLYPDNTTLLMIVEQLTFWLDLLAKILAALGYPVITVGVFDKAKKLEV